MPPQARDSRAARPPDRDSLLIVAALGHDRPDGERAAWPSFRGPQASGVSADAQPPLAWNVTTSTNVALARRHPRPLALEPDRLGRSRLPDDRGVGSRGRRAVAVALGDSDRAGIDPANERVRASLAGAGARSRQRAVVWSRTAHEGVPRVKRHVKSQPCLGDACDQRPHRRRDVRIRGAGGLRHGRQGAVAQGSRRACRRPGRRARRTNGGRPARP